jgi:hypothetical protein
MLARLLLFPILAGLVAVPASAQTLPCVSPATDPCVINSTATVPVGVYDIRPKSLVVGNKQITVSGAGELKILAANVTFQPGARFIATGTDGNTTVTLDATGTIDLQSQGTSKSKIDVSGNFGGGTINLHSVGNLSVNGTLISNATNLLGFGGPITLLSDTGNVTVTGDPSEGIRSFGNAQGGGGSITITATQGSINVSTQLVPKGGDCGSCEVNLTAGGNITTTAQGVIDMRASGVGDGGFASVSAEGDVNLAGSILANGSSDDMDGGTGGDVLISASGSITMSGRVELNGAGQDASIDGFSVDGDSGSVDVSANGAVTITGPMFGIAKGFGQGDEFSVDGGGNVTMAGEIDMTADNFAGDITILSDALITVSARLRTTAPVDLQHPAALGGTIDVEACQVNVTPTGQLISTGPGGSPSGANFVVASTGLTIAGTMLATAENELDWRTSPPVVTGTVTPPPTIINDVNLPCCGVQCPTTTSTSTTSTSSTSSTSTTHAPTTTTTSAPIPTTTSSTAPIPTTTSSTAPIPTTTTSVAPASTTTTSKAPTTTTSSTAAPSTTTSSTAAPSTTTSSTAAPSTTTSSTAGPSTTTSSTAAPSTTTSSTTIGSTTTTTSLPGATTTTSSTAIATTTTSSSTSTLATTTSTNASTTSTPSTTTVAPTSSTAVTTSTTRVPTTSTTQPPLDCRDTTVGLDAVRCRLELLSDEILTNDPEALGGNNLARALANNVARAIKYTAEPTTPKRLKKAATQLKKFAAKLGRAISKGKVDPDLGNELTGLATDARSQLLGLGAS